MKYERQNLINDLKSHVVEVTFIKVNGERRIMRCTLDQRIIPHDNRHLDEQHQKPENLNVIVCWDVQANGWRSFHVSSVEYAQEVEGYL